MKSLRRQSIQEEQINESATSEDFCQAFTENMDRLYLLSLLLTANHQEAQRCFIAGFEDSLGSNKEFKQCAFARAKQAIIQNAICALPLHSDDASSSAAADVFQPSHGQPNVGNLHVEIGTVLALRDFDRFVFVMSVLEHYPDHYCALLLGCSVQDIHRARVKAFQQVAEFVQTTRLNECLRDLQEVRR